MTTEALTAIKAALAAPSAWRWSFDRSWHYATAKPGKFTWADPEVTQPLYAIETSAISSLISSYEAMERRVAELEEALKPFAKWPGDSSKWANEVPVWTVTSHSKEKGALTHGDFRAARRALTPSGEAQ